MKVEVPVEVTSLFDVPRLRVAPANAYPIAAEAHETRAGLETDDNVINLT
jgi:hypothetical protein